jgi:hypothetical protein
MDLSFAPSLLTSVISGYRTQVRRRPIRKIEHDFVDVTPTPSFGRIVGFDDRMPGRMEMLGRVPAWRLIAAADMAASPADAQVQPGLAYFQALFAPEYTRKNVADPCKMPTKFRHTLLPRLI